MSEFVPTAILGLGQAEHMAEQVFAQAAAEALCAHSRKILARQRAGKAHRTQPKHKQAVRNDVFHVAVFNAHVDDICHQQRHKQFQNGLRQLEQRPQNELPAVTVKIAEQCFQTFTSLFSEAVFIHSYFITALPIFKEWIFFFPKLRNQAVLPRYENDVFSGIPQCTAPRRAGRRATDV